MFPAEKLIPKASPPPAPTQTALNFALLVAAADAVVCAEIWLVIYIVSLLFLFEYKK